MQVLIVDEPQQCKTLRAFLTALDYRLVLEASSGDLALKILNERRSRIRLVISELRLPGMSGLDLRAELRSKPWADFTGVVLTSSDGSAEADLSKPFRRSELDRAMNRAMSTIYAARDTILYIGSGGMMFYRIQAALREQETHWRNVIHASTMDEVKAYFSDGGKRIAGIFIDPSLTEGASEATDEISEEELGAFFKAGQGPLRVFVYLSRKAPRSSALRERAEIYFEPSASVLELRRLLRWTSLRMVHAWELEHRALQFKHANQEKNYDKALDQAKKMLRISPENGHAHTSLGEAFLRLGKVRRSREHLIHALRLNPCAPHPYLTLLTTPGLSSGVERQRLAEQALHYCPKHPGIIRLAGGASGGPDGA